MRKAEDILVRAPNSPGLRNLRHRLNVSGNLDLRTPCPVYDDTLLLISSDRILGRGSFGIVKLGDLHGVPVAVKLLKLAREDNNAEAQKTLLRMEYLGLASCPSPYIVQSLGVYTGQKGLGLIMEYMNQGNLSSFLQKNPALSLEDQICLLSQITCGLVFLHRNGYMHRDLKGDNILVRKEGTSLVAKISDLGAGRNHTFHEEKHGVLCGTKGWIAPEVFQNEPHSFASDIFSLGVVFWEIATRGRRPVEGLKRTMHDKTHYLEKIPSDCPERLRNIIERCWKENPALRPNATAVAAAIEAWRKNKPDPFARLAQIRPAMNL